MMRSQAGRLEVFGAVKDLPNEQRAGAIDLITKGVHKPLTRKEVTQQQAVRLENERLSQGLPCPVLVTDDPEVHLPAHRAELDAHREHIQALKDPRSTPEEREKAAGIVRAYLAHMQEHQQVYLQLSPVMAQFFGIKAPPQMGGMLGGSGGNSGDVGELPEGKVGPRNVDDTGVALPEPAQPPSAASA